MKTDYNTNNSSNGNIDCDDDKVKLQLREEQLDISRKLIKTGEVTAYKETIIKEKTITVPITHEDLVIEKKTFNDKNSGEMDIYPETIRIPLSEEQIHITKHKVILENVDIYKHEIQDKQIIEEVLKKENLYVYTSGNPKVIDKNINT